jgi:hypothetical protein
VRQGELVTENLFLYSAREVKRLRKELGDVPLTRAVGRAVCPFCIHLEARWRGAPVPESPGSVEVRILCSQCQRRCVFVVEPRR